MGSSHVPSRTLNISLYPTVFSAFSCRWGRRVMASCKRSELTISSTLAFMRANNSSRGRSSPIFRILNGLSAVCAELSPHRNVFLVRNVEYGLPVV